MAFERQPSQLSDPADLREIMRRCAKYVLRLTRNDPPTLDRPFAWSTRECHQSVRRWNGGYLGIEDVERALTALAEELVIETAPVRGSRSPRRSRRWRVFTLEQVRAFLAEGGAA